jgi:hypothetical protein
MKPLHIVLLVAAGAIGGVVLTNVAHRSHQAAPAPVVAQMPAPPSVPAAVAAPVTEPEKPSPSSTRKDAPRQKLLGAADSGGSPPPVEITQLPAVVEPPPPAPAPDVIPARPEPEPGAPVAPPPPPPPNKVTLNAGTPIPVRLIDGLSSERNNSGDAFTATLDKELVVDGFVIAERGARVEGRVVVADRGGKVRGVAALALELTRIHTADGQTLEVVTDSFEKHAAQTQRQDAEKVGGGAVIGAVIGAIAGGGKGAAIGAGLGGGAGAGDVLLTRGAPATLPSETRITFRLRAPVTVTERRG